MDLNRLGSGKKLIDEIIKQGNTSAMGWTQQQQQEKRNSRKNPHIPKSDSQ